MTKTEVGKLYYEWAEAWIAQRSPYIQSLHQEDQTELLRAHLNDLARAEEDKDPEFSEYMTQIGLEKLAAEYLDSRAPHGRYDPEAMIPLGDGSYIQMRKTARHDLIAWAKLLLNGGSETNIRYALNRLVTWEEHRNCRTLEELEGIE
jgi:hypothetical protein